MTLRQRRVSAATTALAIIYAHGAKWQSIQRKAPPLLSFKEMGHTPPPTPPDTPEPEGAEAIEAAGAADVEHKVSVIRSRILEMLVEAEYDGFKRGLFVGVVIGIIGMTGGILAASKGRVSDSIVGTARRFSSLLNR